MAVVEEATWAPPLSRAAQPPSKDDRIPFAKERGIPVESMDFSDFTKSGFWNVDDVLRPIYENASEHFGREFPYPEGDPEG